MFGKGLPEEPKGWSFEGADNASVLSVKDGDILVIKTDREIEKAVCEKLKEHYDKFGMKVTVMIVGKDDEVTVIRKEM